MKTMECSIRNEVLEALEESLAPLESALLIETFDLNDEGTTSAPRRRAPRMTYDDLTRKLENQNFSRALRKLRQ